LYKATILILEKNKRKSLELFFFTHLKEQFGDFFENFFITNTFFWCCALRWTLFDLKLTLTREHRVRDIRIPDDVVHALTLFLKMSE